MADAFSGTVFAPHDDVSEGGAGGPSKGEEWREREGLEVYNSYDMLVPVNCLTLQPPLHPVQARATRMNSNPPMPAAASLHCLHSLLRTSLLHARV